MLFTICFYSCISVYIYIYQIFQIFIINQYIYISIFVACASINSTKTNIYIYYIIFISLYDFDVYIFINIYMYIQGFIPEYFYTPRSGSLREVSSPFRSNQ